MSVVIQQNLAFNSRTHVCVCAPGFFAC